MKSILSAFLAVGLMASAQITADEIKLQHAGLTLNANLEMSEDFPSGTVLLMTHGTLAHGQMELITTLQELYAENDMSSLALTLSLGQNDRHNMYDCAAPHRHKHTDSLDEIGVWLDYLKQQGVKDVVLLGHSRGGNQTAWFAAERDDAVISKVVLVAPATWSEPYAANNYAKRYNKPLAPVLAKAREMVAAGKGAEMMQPVDFIYCADTSATAASFVNYYTPDPRFDTPNLLPGINKPVLVIAGSEDTTVADLEEKVAPLAESDGITLIVLDGAGHMFRDLYAEDLVDASLDFIGASD